MEQEQKTKLAGALVLAQAEMPVVSFDSSNPFLKNKYASLGAIISASKPILAKHGLAVLQMPVSGTGTIGVETVILHASGESISSRIELPFADEKGKSAAQAAGSIVTYLKRYALASILKMYADEDDDAQPQVKPPTQQRPPQQQFTQPSRKDPTAGDEIPMDTPKPEPVAKKSATKETRKWMLEQLASYENDVLLGYARAKQIILPAGETVKDWSLEKVPTSMTALAALKADIDAWSKTQLTDIPEKPQDRLKVVGQIEKVEIKNSPVGAKKPWTLYIITLGGVDYTTFSKTLAGECSSSEALKETVTLFYEEKEGKKTALELLAPLTP